jgi:alpha-mannosidase
MNAAVEKIFSNRIDQFHQTIGKRILGPWIPFKVEYSPSSTPVPLTDRAQGQFSPIHEGQVWGRAWDNAWFHMQAQVPAEWQGKTVVAQLDITGEGLVLDPQGRLLQGITRGSVFDKQFSRDLVRLYQPCQGGEEVELWVEGAGNDLLGLHLELDPAPDDPARFGHYECRVQRMRLCVFNDEVWHLWLDVAVLTGLVKTLPEKSVRRSRIIRCINEAINALKDDVAHVSRSREILKRELIKPAAASDLNVLAVGHAHIDTAWLWPVRESVRKCARTFASQVSLLQRYPEYVFGASQPQHYQFVKDAYPALYQQIKELVKQKRWEPQGGMWVEADCNLISGESMIRQFLFGKNFFRDEFGIDVKNLWLPDVFGYSAAMPQIMKKCGIDYFLTQKISWSQVNEFPYHTFKWRGIDGSEVLTHFPPENDYNSQLNTASVVPGRDRFKEKDYIDEFISLFGVGDGGGGPKEEFIEYGKRMADLEGSPRVRFGHAADFFERLRAYRDIVPTWVGELYLELHRGTLTTQARVKKMNRKLELRLRAVELLWSCLPLAQYPLSALAEIWRLVLINQFHDILPGSSVHLTYENTHKEHEQCMARCDQLVRQALTLLTQKHEHALTCVNVLSYPVTSIVELPAGWQGAAADEHGAPLPMQWEAERVVVRLTVPPLAGTTIYRIEAKPIPITVNPTLVLENELARYEFDRDATVRYAWDKKAQREILLTNGANNRLSLYNDRPNDWDAWDVDLHYEANLLENAHAVEVQRSADGPVRQGLFFTLSIGHSLIEQTVYLEADSKRLDFYTVVHWREKHRMLRVSFSANTRAENAHFDIQYGFCSRPTHRNTSWDLARFESVAQRYVDLSDADYGVALLNDCKYGHKVLDSTLDLNLLRSTNYPDYDADRGDHEFRYSLFPHQGNHVDADVMAEAARINQDLIVCENQQMMSLDFPCRLEGTGVCLEVIKRAEKEECLILRIVETHGRHSSGELHFLQPRQVYATNLLEWTETLIESAVRSLPIHLAPFEILTLKIKPV